MVDFRRWAIAAVAVVLTGAAAWILWNARGTLARSAAEVRLRNEVRFIERPVERAAVAGVESIASAASFRDAAVYQGKLWLLSSDALWEYSGEGEFLHRYQAGLDLPSAPLVKLLAASMASAGESVLCIATQGAGLVIYDGRAFRQLLPEAAQHRKLTALHALSTGELLLGTEKAGLLAWDGRSLRHYHQSLKGVAVTAIAGAVDSLWVGTLDRGLFFLHAGEISHFDDKSGLPDAHVLTMVVSEDHLYAGTATGVAEFRAGKWERVLAEGTLSQALHFTHGNLLIGTLEEGIVEVPLTGRQPRPQRSVLGIPDQPVSAFLESGNSVYAVLRNAVVARTLDSGASSTGWRRVVQAEPAALADSNIASLAAEESGRLWIGYFDRGLDVMEGLGQRSAAVHHEDEHLFCINRILPDKTGAAVATANGLVFTDTSGTPRRIMGRKEGLIADHVTDIVRDGTGLIAGTPAGITFLGAAPQSISAFHGLVSNHVYSLALSGPRLMAGTLGGVSVLDGGAVTSSYNTSNSALRHNWISALVTVNNEWFAGTYGAGVFRFDGRQWHGYADLGEGLEVNPNAMLATQAAVYAGTLGKGLAIHRAASGRWSFLTAGLPSLNVTALSAANGFLYVGTDNGLVRFVERNLP
ncbi:MAG: hypothetical protein HY820_42500 [Acidobacteria bacterium]|nr:hypothetical protein [Acidobacteriota bacterium]